MPINRKAVKLGGNKQDRVLALLRELPADKGLYADEVIEATGISSSHLSYVGLSFKCSVLIVDETSTHNIRVYINPEHLDKWQ